MISSMSEPASRFSKTVATGIRVPLKTHAPLRRPGTLSTAGHCDQSRVAVAMACSPSFRVRQTVQENSRGRNFQKSVMALTLQFMPLRLQHMCLLLPELLVCLAAIIRVIQHPVWPSDRRPGYDAFRDQILGQLKVSLNQLPRDGRAARQKLVDREPTFQIIQ